MNGCGFAESGAAGFVISLVLLTLVKSAPIVYAALGGVISERSGVINIGLEGLMAAGAFAAAVTSYAMHAGWIGLVAGIVAGAAVGYVFALAVTKFKVDQVVAGMGINLLCSGGAAYGLVLLFNQPGASKTVPQLASANVPCLNMNLGEVLLVVLAFLLAIVLHIVLYRTPWGLRVRATGENPIAVKSAGLNPLRLRMFAVIASGALAGLGGAFLAIGELNLYSDGMTAGRGYIALAAVIFGRWTPFGAMGAAVIFGLFEALQYWIAGQIAWLPADVLASLPYIAALVALAGVTGRVRAPAADGVPF